MAPLCFEKKKKKLGAKRGIEDGKRWNDSLSHKNKEETNYLQ